MEQKCVFVLEDNDDLRELFTFLLEDEQYQVHAYPTATTFWQSLNTLPLPDMIILDVMLPDGNGLDICCELKETPSTHDIPVMIMSAHAHPADMKENCPAEEFIAKPLDIHEFVARIDKHIRPFGQ